MPLIRDYKISVGNVIIQWDKTGIWHIMWIRIRLPGCLINFGRSEWINKDIMLIRIPSEANVHNKMNIASFDTIFYLILSFAYLLDVLVMIGNFRMKELNRL